MQGMKWIVLIMAGILITACFFPWVTLESRELVIGGFYSTVPDFGKPGIVHVFIISLCILFVLIGKVWSVRAAFFLSALNIAWAARNFFIISACRGGICPQKQPALYAVLIASILITVLIALMPVRPGKPWRKVEAGDIEP